jgi:hypothetical protein
MNLINKEFREVGAKETFRIIDVHKNIAITDSREKVDVSRLQDPRFYVMIGPTQLISENVDGKKFNINLDSDYIDPNQFLNSNNTLKLFADTIKSIPTENLPQDDVNIPVTGYVNKNSNMPANNDSAIIIDNDYDEAAEIARKYGVSSVGDSIRSQNEKFAEFIDPEEFSDEITRPVSISQVPELPNTNSNNVKSDPPPTQHIRVDDPVTSMFRNVKRTVDFSLDIKLENKIPRLDFIEMMEDSYQISIIEFLAEEFTEELLKNPNGLKKMVSDKIRSLVYKNEKVPKSKVVRKKSTTPRKKAIKKTIDSK